MRKSYLLATAMLLGASLAFAGTALADRENSAVATVAAEVVANIGISAPSVTVDAGQIQTGDISAGIVWRVDANTEQIIMTCRATDLYKGGDINSEVAPIPLDLTTGMTFDPEFGQPFMADEDTLPFDQAAGDIDGMAAYGTSQITLESSQDGHFSQGVLTTLAWNQDDPEKTMGSYSGKVECTAMVVD